MTSPLAVPFRAGLTLWAFARPHTIVGTTISVVGLAILAAAGIPDFGSVLAALIPSWAANLTIVGLNQLTDRDIDRINKPELPLVAGSLTARAGWWIVGVSGVLAVLTALSQGRYLLGTVVASLGLGVAYSLPPMRLKRYPFWAALCIVGVRGLIVNLGFFAHFRSGLTLTEIPASLWVLTGFVVVFALAIAISKDIPDVEGDRTYQIQTLSVRWGTQPVFMLTCTLLALAYGLVIVTAGLGIPTPRPAGLILSHGMVLLWFLVSARRVNREDKTDIRRFYQHIWRLFFLEYLMFPLGCLL
ncbi:MAG: homogentisate phytyltransferase [Synechococcales cyanobacterium]